MFGSCALSGRWTHGLEIARRETKRNPKGRMETPPDPGGELWAPVRHNVPGDSVEPEHMLYKELTRFCRRQDLLEHKVSGLRGPLWSRSWGFPPREEGA